MLRMIRGQQKFLIKRLHSSYHTERLELHQVNFNSAAATI